MNGNQHLGSFFPGSQAIITGGTFTSIQNSHFHGGAKDGYDKLLEVVAPNALHNSGHIFDPPKCHPGTRVAVIQAIVDWLAGADQDTREKGVHWLTGGAGAGKSAIGRSICERCAQEGTLLASFFFSSSDSTRNHSKSLVSTIAYQLCGIHPTIRIAVSNYIAYDPLIFTKSLRTQFVSLVMDPLMVFYDQEARRVRRLIVIDGLDECVDQSSQCDILETIMDLIKSYSSHAVRFLVCSRPESNIKNFIHGVQMNPMVFTVSLGNNYQSNNDIRKYLLDNFNEIREGHVNKYSIPEGWPGNGNMKQLVEMASGQFIYALTVIKFIKSPRHKPHQRLEIILGLRPPQKDLPFAQLDALYMRILNQTENPPLTVKLLGYVALYPFISTRVLDAYLDLQDGDAEATLHDLAGIVSMQQKEDETFCRVSILHKSFPDFLFNQSRSQTLYYMSWGGTGVSHFLRSLQIFSGQSQGCRFEGSMRRGNGHPPPTSNVDFMVVQDISDCSLAFQAAYLDAFAQFPMESFCKNLFSSHSRRCLEYDFAKGLIYILAKLKKEHDRLEDIFKQYLEILFRCTLWYLRTKDGVNNLQRNFVFVTDCVKASIRFGRLWYESPLDLLQNALTRGIHSTRYCYYDEIRPLLRDGFHKILTISERSRIVSRAALYCLKNLCDIDSTTTVEGTRHLKFEHMDRQTRTRPRKWHMRTSFHNIHKNEERLVFIYYSPVQRRRIYFSTFKKPREMWFRPLEEGSNWVSIFFLASFARPQLVTNQIQFGYFMDYMAYLEYLLKILPMAGRDPELIEFCNKSFSPMSIIFSSLSRRARRAINEYLKRMEAEDYFYSAAATGPHTDAACIPKISSVCSVYS